MATCKSCNGTGKMSLNVSQAGKTTPFSITCIYCNGSGSLSDAQQKANEAAKALWCSCGNPSESTTYYADGTHPSCSKHCYVCDDCGKITQVG